MKEIVQLLLEAPDNQLDEQAKVFIRQWDEVPTALQILKVLDICVHAALASSFAMSVLNVMYENALKAEGKKHEDLVPLATWRTNGTME